MKDSTLSKLNPLGADRRRNRRDLAVPVLGAALVAVVLGAFYLEGQYKVLVSESFQSGRASAAERSDRERWALAANPLVICHRMDKLETKADAPAGAVVVLMQETPVFGYYLACWPSLPASPLVAP